MKFTLQNYFTAEPSRQSHPMDAPYAIGSVQVRVLGASRSCRASAGTRGGDIRDIS